MLRHAKLFVKKHLNESLLTVCMFFIMKNNVKPVWEDDNNKDGGCFSFKLQNKNCTQFMEYSCL